MFVQKPSTEVAIKIIQKKNLAKSQSLLDKEIKILKVTLTFFHFFELSKQFVTVFKFLLQELTELQHENVVALLECVVSATVFVC